MNKYEPGQYRELTLADLVDINKRLIKSGGVIRRSNGALRVDTDSDAILSQVNRSMKIKNLVEASALHDIKIDDTETSKNDTIRDASQLEIGDEVVISGNVSYKGKNGTISRFGVDKKFVVVKMNSTGSEHSFHSSDVSEVEHEEEEEEEIEEHGDTHDKFFVAFYEEDEERSWIGLVTKEGGGKWHEKQFKGKPDYRWGQTYMSYLSPDDIMTWIHKDYRRVTEIEGPFYDSKEAEQYVKSNWGTLSESVDVKPNAKLVALLNAGLREAIKFTQKSGMLNGTSIEKLVAEYTGVAESLKAAAVNRDTFSSAIRKLRPDRDGIVLLDGFMSFVLTHAKVKNVNELMDNIFPALHKEDVDSAMSVLNTAAQTLGKDFRLLEVTKAKSLVDFEAADKIAESFGAKYFWSLSPARMTQIINENANLLIGDAKALVEDQKANKRNLENYRQMVLLALKESEKFLHHIAEEELISCKVNSIQPSGDVMEKNKFKMDSKIECTFYVDCNDKPRKEGLQRDLTTKLQTRLKQHTLANLGVINCKVMHAQIDNIKISEASHDDYTWSDLEKWKTAVKNANPTKADKMKFKSKIESGVRTISAEIPGEDRSYGVWDMKDNTGHILGESK